MRARRSWPPLPPDLREHTKNYPRRAGIEIRGDSKVTKDAALTTYSQGLAGSRHPELIHRAAVDLETPHVCAAALSEPPGT